MELPHNEPSKIKMETIRKRVDCRWLFRQFSRFRKATSLSNLLVNFCIDPAFSKWGFAIEAAQRSKQARSVLWITYPEIIGQHRFPYQEATYSADAISHLVGLSRNRKLGFRHGTSTGCALHGQLSSSSLNALCEKVSYDAITRYSALFCLKLFWSSMKPADFRQSASCPNRNG